MLSQSVRRVIQSQVGARNAIVRRTIYTNMSSSGLSGVPRNRISFAEKAATGVLMTLGILFTPAWIMTHMDDYRTIEVK